MNIFVAIVYALITGFLYVTIGTLVVALFNIIYENSGIRTWVRVVALVYWPVTLVAIVVMAIVVLFRLWGEWVGNRLKGIVENSGEDRTAG